MSGGDKVLWFFLGAWFTTAAILGFIANDWKGLLVGLAVAAALIAASG